MFIITLSGFKRSNKLRSLGDLSFYVPNNSYGYVEILHLTILHSFLDFLMKKNSFGVLEFGEKITDLNFDSFEIMKTKKISKSKFLFVSNNFKFGYKRNGDVILLKKFLFQEI